MKDTAIIINGLVKDVCGLDISSDIEKAAAVDYSALTPDEIKKLLDAAMCKNHGGKMAGIMSLSTSPLMNMHCIERMKSGAAVCSHCFSARMQGRYNTLRAKLIRNTFFLTSCDIPSEAVPVINANIFRFEAFGDLVNTLQVKNYFTIAAANPGTMFALWTKNPWIIADAMSEYGISKPDNINIILSSTLLNMSADVAAVAAKYDFVDKVFTVFDKDHAGDVEINCGARCCNTCRRCYTKTDGIELINELLK